MPTNTPPTRRGTFADGPKQNAAGRRRPVARPAAVILLGSLMAAAGAAGDGETQFRKLAPQVTLRVPGLREASGMAAAVGDRNLLWLINDSGNAPLLHLVGSDGEDRGRLTLEAAGNTDWEDLAAFSREGKGYLLVADVGDNGARRASCSLHVVAEPPLPPAGQHLEASAKPAWTIRFRYPDGARDCESVAVDAQRGKVLLLSKRTTPPELYELPLSPAPAALVVATKIGKTELPLPPGVFPHPVVLQPTGLDIRADGTMAAVVTYAGAFVFPRGGRESWAQAFARKPLSLPLHGLRQAEAVAFSRDGKTLFVTSEGANSPLVRYQETASPASP